LALLSYDAHAGWDGKPVPRTLTLAVVSSRVEAELMVGMLRSNGVRALVSTDDAGGTEPALSAQGVRVLVAVDDAPEARGG
jgi:hypothetical protein